MDQFLARFVEPFDDFQKNDVVGSHGSPMQRVERKDGLKDFFRISG
jgi:hypothetical protein